MVCVVRSRRVRPNCALSRDAGEVGQWSGRSRPGRFIAGITGVNGRSGSARSPRSRATETATPTSDDRRDDDERGVDAPERGVDAPERGEPERGE